MAYKPELWREEYNDKIKRVIEKPFVNHINAREFLAYSYTHAPGGLFTKQEADNIKAELVRTGLHGGARLLLERLVTKCDWFKSMVKILQDEDLCSGFLADEMMRLKDEVDKTLIQQFSSIGFPTQAQMVCLQDEIKALRASRDQEKRHMEYAMLQMDEKMEDMRQSYEMTVHALAERVQMAELSVASKEKEAENSILNLKEEEKKELKNLRIEMERMMDQRLQPLESDMERVNTEQAGQKQKLSAVSEQVKNLKTMQESTPGDSAVSMDALGYNETRPKTVIVPKKDKVYDAAPDPPIPDRSTNSNMFAVKVRLNCSRNGTVLPGQFLETTVALIDDDAKVFNIDTSEYMTPRDGLYLFLLYVRQAGEGSMEVHVEHKGSRACMACLRTRNDEDVRNSCGIKRRSEGDKIGVRVIDVEGDARLKCCLFSACWLGP